jgi:catechol 2,3-dioxygenase-like lactoylglutathione lyase family enzyme
LDLSPLAAFQNGRNALDRTEGDLPMMIALNHMIVPARDKVASARWLADLFGLDVRDTSPFSPPGRFAVVRVGQVNFDFDEVQTFEPHHYAFLVDDEAFDRILARVKALGLTYAADPVYRQRGTLSHHAGGRGCYFRDPNGHNLELLTRTGENAGI